MSVIIALDVAHDSLESAIEALAKQPEIGWISTTTGRFDIIALEQFYSSERLSNFITKERTQLKGVKDSETFVCLNVKKGRYIHLT